VRLLDVASTQANSNADVEVWADNGIHCVRAPCETDGKQWNGRTDASGYVVIPTSAVKAATSIKTPAHSADLIEDSERDAKGEWVTELVPEDSADAGPARSS
jgi:hypothetical protein